MTLTATERQFLHIAKAAVSGGELPAENVDWPAVFTLAGQQKLLPIVFEAARKTPAAAENAALFAAVKQQVIAQVLHQTMRASEFAGLYQRLRAAGLHPVVVKGQLCSRIRRPITVSARMMTSTFLMQSSWPATSSFLQTV